VTLLTSLARVVAARVGRAQPTKTRRHVHLSARPLMLIPLQLAGEACAPLAAMVGDDRHKPLQLTVYEPRDRSRRFEFTADLAEAVLAYIDGFATEPEDGQPFPDAPQLLMPTAGGVAFTRLLGRSTRFRRTDGEYAVPAAVPLLGRWLSYYAERAEVTGSALLVPLTGALADHWATGQSATEDANLAALLSWIDPPDGMTGSEAARVAEDPVRCPPAGPATDPTFDNEVLDHLLKAVRDAAAAGDGTALARAQAAMDAALRSQLEPTWELMWRSVDLLRALPEAASVPERWKSDRWSFTSQVGWLRDGGAPQPRRDGAVAAARRLARLEREQQRLAVQRAYDDPLVMAEHRLTGEAFAGTVTAADPARLDTEGRRAKLRPWITVATMDEVILEPGAVLRSPDRPGQEATVIEVAVAGDAVAGDAAPGDLTRVTHVTRVTLVALELKGGMGQAKSAPPGTMPEVGDEVTYTTLRDEFQRVPEFPARENTPWTHGGPPEDYAATDDDAREDWS
jgi:hypothetical protein